MMPEDVPFVFLLEMLEELYCEGSLEGQTNSRLVLWCSCVTKAKKSSGQNQSRTWSMRLATSDGKVDENLGKYWTVE
jgi:hypothetical protein